MTAAGTQRDGLALRRAAFLCCNGDDRSLRLKQGAEAGAVFWFFKAPQGRCGKNSKHNPCSTPPKSPEVFCAAVCDRLEP